MLDDMYNLSFYKEIGVLNQSHNVSIVQHIQTGRTFIKKIMNIYNKDVFLRLQSQPIAGLPKIFEVCEQDDKLVVIEEYISGKTLQEILDEHGKIPVKNVTNYIVQLCNTLSLLHSMNPPIIHRDIKPSNIILTDDNRIILIDLNGAKIANNNQSRDTQLIGTQGYAAPEQYGFRASNIQTDIYSVGILMVALLTGTPANSNDYKGPLSRIIKKCLQIDPKNRFKSCKQLMDAIRGRNTKYVIIPIVCTLSTAIILAILIITIGIYQSIDSSLIDNPNYIVLNSYANAEDFEYGLNCGADLVGTSVTFEVLDIRPESHYGYNIWAGEHLNFISDGPPSIDINVGDILTVTVTNIERKLGSWFIYYTEIKKVDSKSSQHVTDATNNNIVGVYKGNDNELLVIADTGLAYYYCFDTEYTELECPWLIENDIIYISLSKMHCVIDAHINSTNNGSLIFRSESTNWNTEEFLFYSSDITSNILNPPPTVNEDVLVYSDGTMQLDLENIQFTIPKQFINYDSSQGLTIFIDQDPYGGYLGDLIFIQSAKPNDYSERYLEDSYLSLAESVTSGIMNYVQIGHSECTKIAGCSSYIVNISGLLNDGFGPLENSIYGGYVAIIDNPTSNNFSYVLFVQILGDDQDDTEIVNQILNTAILIK